jgi:Skp family chaperone for outer membrane proteins
MNRRRAACLTVGVLILLHGRADAQDNKAPLVGVVSSQRVSTETEVGRAGIARVQALQQEKEKDLRAKAVALDATRKSLLKTSDAATRAALQRQADEERAVFEKATAQAQNEIQALQRQVSVDLTNRVKEVLADIVKTTQLQVVLQTESGVLWAAPSTDLTNAVISRLNASRPRTP